MIKISNSDQQLAPKLECTFCLTSSDKMAYWSVSKYIGASLSFIPMPNYLDRQNCENDVKNIKIYAILMVWAKKKIDTILNLFDGFILMPIFNFWSLRNRSSVWLIFEKMYEIDTILMVLNKKIKKFDWCSVNILANQSS